MAAVEQAADGELANHMEDLKLQEAPAEQTTQQDAVRKSGSGGGGSTDEQQHRQASSGNAAANGGGTNAGAILPDPALLSALMDHTKERGLVLRMEQEVLAFLGDTARDIFEFPVDYSNYQRMLAHKVAQYYGLQTSTSDYEGNQCRVVAHRCGPLDKSKPLLASLDVSQGSALAAAATKVAGTWQEAPKLLRRPGSSRHHNDRPMPGGGYDTASNSSMRTPKEREEEYERARARILDGSSSSSMPGSAGVPPVLGGRGGPGRGIIAGRGRRGGRGDRSMELQHDTEYMRGMPRFGMIGMYDGTQPVSPVFMPPGTPVVYAMPQQPEMTAWGPMYVPGRQPPPPPPSSAGSYGKQTHASGSTAGSSMWVGNSSAPPSALSSSSAGASTTHSGSTTAAVVPPPPPPPHPASARPYQQPAATPMTPMAMYPTAAGGMQPIPGGPVYTYMAYPGYAGAMHGGMAYPGMVHAAYPGTMAGYPGAMHAGYPAGAMQAMTPQGYPMFPAAPAATTAGAGAPAASMQMQMAYPVHAIPPGYQAIPYPMAMQQAPGLAPGATAATAQVHYGGAMVAHPGALPAAAGAYHPGGSGMGAGRGRGGYRQQQQHSGGVGAHAQTHVGQAPQQQPPPPPVNGAAAGATRTGSGPASNGANGKREG